GADGEGFGRIARVDLVEHALLLRRRDLRSYLVEVLLDRRGETLAIPADGAAEERRRLGDVRQADRIDDEHGERLRRELLERAVGDLHAHDEVGAERHDLLEIHLDAADLLLRRRRGWLVGEVIDADDAVAG